MLADVVIVGGGLSGLNAAVTLLEERSDLRVTMLEAADRLGGRLYGSNGTTYNTTSNTDTTESEEGTGSVDLGGAWMWLQFQPELRHFVEKHGIEVVQQEG